MKTRKFSKQKTDRLQEGDWDDKRFDKGMTICVCIVIFRALRKMSVLVAAQHTANAVMQTCKV